MKAPGIRLLTTDMPAEMVTAGMRYLHEESERWIRTYVRMLEEQRRTRARQAVASARRKEENAVRRAFRAQLKLESLLGRELTWDERTGKEPIALRDRAGTGDEGQS